MDVPTAVPLLKNGRGGNTASSGYCINVASVAAVFTVDVIVDALATVVATDAFGLACVDGPSDVRNEGIGSKGNPSNDRDSTIADVSVC